MSAQPDTLLASKLQPPQFTSGILARPALFRRLEAGLTGKLTLIAAPAGFGKTTLVQSWLRQWMAQSSQHRYAWLALDFFDNDPMRFMRYLIAALQRLYPDVALPTPHIASDANDTRAILTAALSAIPHNNMHNDRQRILVLDDWHVIEQIPVEQLLDYLLAYAPPTLHLVMTSRIDPPLPLSRMRVRHQLNEIRAHDLRFSPDEAAILMRQTLNLNLTDDIINAVYTRTEGWAAGLQLAAIALQRDATDTAQFMAQFTGTHHYIFDYLMDEVFSQQEPVIQQFLLDTAHLNRLHADLCDAVRDAGDSRALLQALYEANLFIIALDEQRRWYRYHHLFGDLLRQRANEQQANRLPSLHQRAAAWYAQRVERGQWAALDEVMHHALQVPDQSVAAGWLNQFVDGVWERGEHDKLRQWLNALPDTVRGDYPRLGITQAWLYLTHGDYDRMQQALNQCEQALVNHPERIELSGRIAATRAFRATFANDFASTATYAQQALNNLNETASTWRSTAMIALGDALAIQGDALRASQQYRDALRMTHRSGNLYLAFNAAFKLAGTLRQQALLHDPYAICAEQWQHAESSGLQKTAVAGCLAGMRGDIHGEWNQLDEALAYTQYALEAAQYSRHIGFLGWIYLYRGRALLWARQLDALEALLNQIDVMAQTTALPQWIISPVAALRGLTWLAHDNLAACEAWAISRNLHVDDTPHPLREYEYMVLVRLLLAQSRPEAALPLLASMRQAAEQRQRLNSLLIIDELRALALYQQGKQTDALAALSQALQQGERGGYIRVFLEGGAEMAALLQMAVAQGLSSDYARTLLNAMPAIWRNAAQTLDEPLSERELDVLRLIAGGLSNQAIADHLTISLNTVLYHTKNIYGKLAVQRRTQAVQRARELGLL